jgi:flagellar biosynthesis GTPase FlhF
MIITKIEADSMSAALTRAKELFGNEAKIHSTATLTNGKFQIIASAKKLRPTTISKPIMVMDEPSQDGNYLEEFVSDREGLISLRSDVDQIRQSMENKMDSFSKTLYQASWGMETRMHPTMPQAIGMLLENGISASDAKDLAVNLPRSESATINVVSERILNKASFSEGITKGINCFIGATGSGKTSVMIKSAIELSKLGNNVCMVVGDANSPGAHDDLDRIGSIINVDVFAEPSDVPRGYYSHVLIDNPTDNSINSNKVKKHLVISASSQEQVNDKFLYLRSKISSTIFTKLDEVSKVGFPIMVSSKINAPISLLNNSPDLSTKLQVANKNNIKEYISLSTDDDSAIVNSISMEHKYA